MGAESLQLLSLVQCHLFPVLFLFMTRHIILVLSCLRVSVYLHFSQHSHSTHFVNPFCTFFMLSQSQGFYILCFVREPLMVLQLQTRLMALHESAMSSSLSSAQCCDIRPASRRAVSGVFVTLQSTQATPSRECQQRGYRFEH